MAGVRCSWCLWCPYRAAITRFNRRRRERSTGPLQYERLPNKNSLLKAT